MKNEKLKKYSFLYRKYYNECREKEKQYDIKHNLVGKQRDSLRHPKYFEIGEQWKRRRERLNAPFLKMAKYKKGDDLVFVKENWIQIPAGYRKEIILSHGIVTGIDMSHDGSGQVLYHFNVLSPPCPEGNPYCLEKDVIGVFTGKFTQVQINKSEIKIKRLKAQTKKVVKQNDSRYKDKKINTKKFVINQEHYQKLEIDTNEKDVVQIIGYERTDPQIIFIERENISQLIKLLQNEIHK